MHTISHAFPFLLHLTDDEVDDFQRRMAEELAVASNRKERASGIDSLVREYEMLAAAHRAEAKKRVRDAADRELLDLRDRVDRLTERIFCKDEKLGLLRLRNESLDDRLHRVRMVVLRDHERGVWTDPSEIGDIVGWQN